jgi:hypothetical protein
MIKIDDTKITSHKTAKSPQIIAKNAGSSLVAVKSTAPRKVPRTWLEWPGSLGSPPQLYLSFSRETGLSAVVSLLPSQPAFTGHGPSAEAVNPVLEKQLGQPLPPSD